MNLGVGYASYMSFLWPGSIYLWTETCKLAKILIRFINILRGCDDRLLCVLRYCFKQGLPKVKNNVEYKVARNAL